MASVQPRAFSTYENSTFCRRKQIDMMIRVSPSDIHLCSIFNRKSDQKCSHIAFNCISYYCKAPCDFASEYIFQILFHQFNDKIHNKCPKSVLAF